MANSFKCDFTMLRSDKLKEHASVEVTSPYPIDRVKCTIISNKSETIMEYVRSQPPKKQSQIIQLLTFVSTNLFMTNYTDRPSVGNCAVKDLELSVYKEIVANNSYQFKKATRNDIVWIIARGSDGIIKLCFGIIGKQVPGCDKWAVKGGRRWKYTYKFFPFTPIISLSEISDDLDDAAAATEEDVSSIYKSRFCFMENSLKNVLRYMIANETLPLL